MPSCRIDGMASSKGADRPASRSLAGPLAPSWRSHSNIFTPTQQLSLRRVGRRLRRRTQYWCMQMYPLASRSSILFQQPRFGTMPRCGSYWDGHASPETWSASAIVCRISNTRSRQVLWSSRCSEGFTPHKVNCTCIRFACCKPPTARRHRSCRFEIRHSSPR